MEKAMANCYQLVPCMPRYKLMNHFRPTCVQHITARPSFLIKNCHHRNSRILCCSSSSSSSNSIPFDIGILEYYTQRVPSEILLVHAVVDNEEDEVLVFKGHSSSLMRATSSDLEEEVLPQTADIESIDRMKGPYNPVDPQYIAKDLSWDEFLSFVKSKGL